MSKLPLKHIKEHPSAPLPADFCSNPDVAWTLPASYYTSPEVFKREVDTIFTKDWICVAHRSELAQANQYVTRDLIDENILIVRGKDNVLRAFYNVCPHRGHRLLEGSGNAKNVITCPYHAWAFKLDGAMAHAPNCENVEAFDKEKNGLSPIKVEEYAGFVFINLNPEATCVEDQLPGLQARLRKACPEVDNLKLAARFTTPTPANWKNIVDNYLECYHCGPAHPSFSSSMRMDCYRHTLHGNWTLQYSDAQSSDRAFKVDASVQDPNFSGFWAWPCTAFNVPPGGDFMTVIYEYPISAGVTLQNYDIYFLNETLTEDQQRLVEWYRTVFRPEDLRLVESVQQGLTSRGYRGQGRIMTDKARSGISEHGIAHFHQLVANRSQA
ncbi:carnitine monooxygenase subunit YeaW [Paraburkholderia unamae]|uniref:aromatic ring-hydroxylating oxygenase subunit alpha n=1 Tax=Paraburkholderia unamae TaxID=219649 RepID=UPI001CB35ACD|nr:ring-hydroxylating oxygenase subunit alpha [Paraburkholderia unamae]CAG9264237.1 carnitine monooxygenase subunit YeaW [Paraburkholderia unamae]